MERFKITAIGIFFLVTSPQSTRLVTNDSLLTQHSAGRVPVEHTSHLPYYCIPPRPRTHQKPAWITHDVCKCYNIAFVVLWRENVSTQVWFTSTTSSENVFHGNPMWNISSSQAERTSIPQSQAIQLNGLKFTEASNVHWPTKTDLEITGMEDRRTVRTTNSTILLTLNMQIVIGSSVASKEDGGIGVDKFKLLGITTCWLKGEGLTAVTPSFKNDR